MTGTSPSTPRPWSAIRFVLSTVAFLAPIAISVSVVLLLRDGDDGPRGREPMVANGVVRTYLIPAGTRDRMDRGIFTEDIMPEQVTVDIGDTVVVVNEDKVTHTLGPFTVRAGETQRMVFSEPGYYFGVCTVGDHDTITITAV